MWSTPGMLILPFTQLPIELFPSAWQKPDIGIYSLARAQKSFESLFSQETLRETSSKCALLRDKWVLTGRREHNKGRRARVNLWGLARVDSRGGWAPAIGGPFFTYKKSPLLWGNVLWLVWKESRSFVFNANRLFIPYFLPSVILHSKTLNLELT